MTVFRATKPVSLTPALVETAFEVFNGNPHFVIHTSTEFKVTDAHDNVEIDITGHGFVYFHGQPILGTITGVQINTVQVPDVHEVPSIAYKFSGLSLPVPNLVSVVNHSFHTGNFGPVLNLFLPGHDRIFGSPGSDILPDHGGHDRITGGAGNDIMRGAGGNDTFVFHPGFGNDVINHFIAGSGANHDVLELHSIPAVQLTIHQIGGGTFLVSDTMGDSITLTHVTGHLNSHDFHFLA